MRRWVRVKVSITTGDPGRDVAATVARRVGRRYAVLRALRCGPDAEPGVVATVQEAAEELAADVARRASEGEL